MSAESNAAVFDKSQTPATERKKTTPGFRLAPGEDEQTTIYLANFERCLKTVDRPDYAILFTDDEKAMIRNFGSLSRQARGLYTRMLQRKGPWFRTDSLLGYKELSNSDEPIDSDSDGQGGEAAWQRAHQALADMVENGFAEGIAADSKGLDLEEVLSAVDCCLKLEEMRGLVGRLTKKSVAGLSKKSLIDTLRNGLNGQRTLIQFFNSQKDSPKRESQVTAEAIRALVPKELADTGMNLIVMSKLSETSVRLSRRVMRLVFLTSSGGYGSSTSVLFPVLNPALLADFGKVQYADYECKVERSVFASRRRFLLWEAGQELRCAWEMSIASSDGKRSEIPKLPSKVAASAPDGPKQTFLSNVKSEKVSQKAPEQDDVIYISDDEAVIITSPAPVQEVKSSRTQEETFLISAAMEAAQLFAGHEAMEAYKNGLTGDGADKTLHEGVLHVAAACLRSYLRERSLETDGGWDSDRDYLLQLDPGWSISSIVWCGVDTLERSQRYQDAASLLSLLLSTRFLRHKRAEMFNRLALDRQHLGDDEGALSVCSEALGDVRVTGGDRVTISKRHERLEAKILKSKSKQKAAVATDEIGDGDDFDMETLAEKRQRKKSQREAKSAIKRKRLKESEVMDASADAMYAECISTEERKLLGLVEKSPDIVEDVIRGVRHSGSKAVGKKSKFAGFDQHGPDGSAGLLCSVEELCLQHYGVDGGGDWSGVHCEGGCFYTLFGLFFWDVIFSSDVPDVFLTRYQDAPLDLHSYPHFYNNRQSQIASTLSRLEQSDIHSLCEWVGRAWDENFEKACRGVSWSGYTKKFCQTVAMCIGGRGLSGICRALCVNYKHFHGGLPDLLLLKGSRRPSSSNHWESVDLDQLVGGAGVKRRGFEAREEGDWEDLKAFHATKTSVKSRKGASKVQNVHDTSEPAEEEAGEIAFDDVVLEDGYVYSFEARLVEVKGPNDTLMERQRLWLQILASTGVDARVCRVIEDLEEE